MSMSKLRLRSSETLDSFLGLYIDKPYHCFGGGCLTLFVLTVISVLTGCMTMTLDQESAWRVHYGSSTQAMSGFALARRARSGGAGARALQSDDEGPRPQPLLLMYKAASGGSVFAPALLQDICRMEVRLVRQGSGVCPQSGGLPGGRCPDYSPVATFYGGLERARDDGCPLLAQADVDATTAAIAEDTARHGSSSRYAFLVTPEFVGTNATLYTRSRFRILAGSTEETEEFVLNEIFGSFDPPKSYGYLQSPFLGDDDRMLEFGGVRVRLYYGFDEFMRMLPADFSFAVCSMVFVALTMYLHLGSFFLASFGMWQIVVSLPIAAIFYRKIFMVEYFEFLHVLVVYLVLGVGADDIFVLLDAWRHIKSEHEIQWGRDSVPREKLHRALRETWIRTAGAIFNTSFTTGVAFMSMSVSKVMPMKTCGYFAAISIVLNFVFTITFTPSILMVHQYHFGGKRCCCRCPPAPVEPDTTEDGGEAPREGHGGPDQNSGYFSACIERFLSKVYLPMMQKRWGALKPLPLFLVLVMSVVGVQGAYFASRLTPPSRPEEWFPSNHMWLGLSEFISSTFYSPDYERYDKAWLVWGLAGMNFDNFNEYKPDDYPAEVEYDGSFDLSTREAQQAFLDTCHGIRNLGCTLPGCRGDRGAYVLQAGDQQAFSCVLEDFQRWLAATQNLSDMPQGPRFLSLLERFRSEADPSVYGEGVTDMLHVDYTELLGFADGRLRHAAIALRSTMLEREPYGSGVEVRALVEEYVQRRVGSLPPSMGSLKVASERFANFDLGQELVSGLFSGMAIAGPLVFVVLLLSTRNVVLALYAVVSVAAIVVSVLGFCKSAMDYDLGVGEAIAGIIVIGYSVDYVVHFAHTYCEASQQGIQTRDRRAAFTIENMGSTVFAGAITTCGSGVFMFFCFLTFFTKMALLICMTILYSFLYSLCLFMGLCFLIGPEREFGDICRCLHRSSDTSKDSVRPV